MAYVGALVYTVVCHVDLDAAASRRWKSWREIWRQLIIDRCVCVRVRVRALLTGGNTEQSTADF